MFTRVTSGCLFAKLTSACPPLQPEFNFSTNGAEKFATGALAGELAAAKKALFTTLSERVKKAEVEETAAIKDVEERYTQFLKETDEKVEALQRLGLERLDDAYQKLCQIAKNSSDVEELLQTAKKIDEFYGYKDSKEMKEYCRKRAAEERAKLRTEAEQQRKIAKERAVQKRKNGIILAGIAAIIIVAAVVVIKVVIPNSKYNNAVALMDAGQYEEAIAAFEAMDGYKESANLRGYCEAENYLAMGNVAQAAMRFSTLNYLDSAERSRKLWDNIATREMIAIGWSSTTGLKEDGTVITTGEDIDIVDTLSEWKDIVAIADGGGSLVVGLKSEGTVVTAGNFPISGEYDMSSWEDIVAVDAGDFYAAGLRADGTVVAVGYNYNGQCNVSDWTDIVAISAGGGGIVGLKMDGTVVAAGDHWREWANVHIKTRMINITAIDAGRMHIVGLRADGRVTAIGKNDCGQCDVSDWRDIVAVAAGSEHTVGLKADGTVVAVGRNDRGQCDVSDWTDIVEIFAGCDQNNTYGLKADGTVVAVGQNDRGQCDVTDWTDIKLPN